MKEKLIPSPYQANPSTPTGDFVGARKSAQQEELDKVKSIRKVRMKSGAKYLFVFRVPRTMTMDEYNRLASRIQQQGESLEKKMGITWQAIILDSGMTLDIVEKEEEIKK